MATSFDFKKRLGSGHFGEVWLAVDTGLNSTCALKCIPPEKIINQANFFQEAQVLKMAEHPNIVKVLETGTLSDDRIYIKMEFLKKGSLDDEASGAYVHLTRAKRVMIDVLRGLEYAHSKGIVHRDIKPANILIGDALEGKLSDFGLALPNIKSVDLSNIKQYQYTLHLAPEVNRFKDYSTVSDIYACGITLYRLVNGDSYLPQISPQEARYRAINGKFPDRNHYRDFVPRTLKVVINRAMNINPSRRFQTAVDFRHALEQVTIQMNWNEQILQNGKRWSATHNGICYLLERTEVKRNSWKVELRKGKSKLTLRRVSNLCFEGLSRKAAESKSRKILQAYVNGTIPSIV